MPCELRCRRRRRRKGSRSRTSCEIGRHPHPGDDALESSALLRILLDERVGAGHPGRVHRCRAERQHDGVAHGPGQRSSRASSSTGWRSSSACRRAFTATSRTRPRSRRSRRSPPRASSFRTAPSSPPSRPTSRSRRPRVCSGSSQDAARRRRVPDACRCRRAELERGGVAAVVPTVGTTGTTAVDPVAPIADLCAAHGAWLHVDAAYAGSAAICPEFRWASPAPSVLIRSSSTPTSGSSPRWTARVSGRAGPTFCSGLQCAARVPAHTRGRRGQPEGLRPGARPAFPRAQALGRDALLRPRRLAAPDPRARPLRRSVRFVDRGRARLGASSRRIRSPSCAFGGRLRRGERGAARARERDGEMYISGPG